MAGRSTADEPRLPPVQVETLGLFGADDPYLSERAMTASEAFVAPGRWRHGPLDGAGHWLQLEQPERVNDLLIDFLGV